MWLILGVVLLCFHAQEVLGSEETSFEKIRGGALCETEGYAEITSATECQAAARKLGLQWKAAWYGNNHFPGCLLSEIGQKKVYFNLSPNPRRTDLNPNFAAICKERDCNWGSWFPWGSCSLSCGGGTQTRNRIKTVHESNGGTCVGKSTETRNCNSDECSLTAHDCENTRDNGDGWKCAFQLRNGETCENYLGWKDCDKSCNLCACSTASITKTEHCSGHGKCEATCTKHICTNAKCKCDSGWTGDKCQHDYYTVKKGGYYTVQKGGLCYDESDVIPSVSDCEEALKELGYSSLSTFWITSTDPIPAGCSIDFANSNVHFLENTSGLGKKRTFLTPVCKKTATIIQTCEKCPKGVCDRNSGKCRIYSDGYHCQLGSAGVQCAYGSSCFKHGGKQFFTWIGRAANIDDDPCYFPDTCFLQNVSYRWEDSDINRDKPGFGSAGVIRTVNSTEECQHLCQRTGNRWGGFTWYSDSNRCYCPTNLSSASHREGAISGPYNCGYKPVVEEATMCAAKYHIPGHENGYASLEKAIAACDDESACGCIDFECDRTHTDRDSNKKYYLAKGRKTRKEVIYNRAMCSVVKT